MGKKADFSIPETVEMRASSAFSENFFLEKISAQTLYLHLRSLIFLGKKERIKSHAEEFVDSRVACKSKDN